jgi:hypothetical protein
MVPICEDAATGTNNDTRRRKRGFPPTLTGRIHLRRHTGLCAPGSFDTADENKRQTTTAAANTCPPWLHRPHTHGMLGTIPDIAIRFAWLLTGMQKAVNSRLGRADNERFLEHFRYLIVASQLLGEQGGLRASAIPSFAIPGPHEFKVATISPVGAGLTAATAFILVWLVHWSRRQPTFSTGRTLLVVLVFAAVATGVYTYMRRQWLQYLRQEAVESASALVANLQAFEASTSSALALIQEVELVSRGYRLYVPVPAKASLPTPTDILIVAAALCPLFRVWKRKDRPAAVSACAGLSERPMLTPFRCLPSSVTY